jgi:hypothetical protein
MTRSDQESPVPEIGTPGLMRRGLETGRRVPRQPSTLIRTAKALGLTMPASALLRADAIIEWRPGQRSRHDRDAHPAPAAVEIPPPGPEAGDCRNAIFVALCVP